MRKTFESRFTVILLWVLFVAAVGALVGCFRNGPSETNLIAAKIAGLDLSLALRFDSLSTVMLTMVTLLSAVVGQYSLRYLDGDGRQSYFFRWLLTTVLSVMFLVASSNLLVFFGAWLMVSWGLHHLLIYYPERKAAVYAARKKLLISRLGDVAILVAIGLVYRAYGTFDFEKIFQLANDSGSAITLENGRLLAAAGALFVAGAVTKSAQFPFHFWLPETMETPAPVSALMHAGIINAGGFLILRLSPIIQHAHYASLMLAVVGSVTAVFGALVMITQNDIKKKLAYSTISQMGMMMFACGIGAYSFALFHIIAHSFYKAHAFLSTGTLVEESKKASLTVRPLNVPLASFVVALGLSLMVASMTMGSGVYLPHFTYAAVLVLGLLQNFGSIRDKRVPLGRMISTVCAVLVLGGIAFAVAELSLGQFVSAELVTPKEPTDWTDPLVYICFGSFAIFTCGIWLTNGLLSSTSDLFKRLYVHFWNGLYMGPGSSRIIRKLWPA